MNATMRLRATLVTMIFWLASAAAAEDSWTVAGEALLNEVDPTRGY